MRLLADHTIEHTFGTVVPPSPVQAIGPGAQGIGTFFGNIINIIFIFAGIVFLFIVIISAFQWMISGGDKENIAKARGRLTSGIIGLIILSLSFVIVRLIETITGLTIVQSPPFFGRIFSI